MAAASSSLARRTRTALLACGRRNELRDGRDLRRGELALERGHDSPANLDLVLGNGLTRLELIEVGADRARRLRGSERVAAAAGGLEERLPVGLVAGRGRLAARAAAGEQEQCAEERESAPHYAGGALPVVPSFETASSRVG